MEEGEGYLRNGFRVCSMTQGELNAIVAGGESEHVEFKKSTGQRTDAAKAVCAMLNDRDYGIGGGSIGLPSSTTGWRLAALDRYVLVSHPRIC